MFENSVEDSLSGRIMTLCSRSDYWLALMRIGEREFSRKLYPAQVSQVTHLFVLFCLLVGITILTLLETEEVERDTLGLFAVSLI